MKKYNNTSIEYLKLEELLTILCYTDKKDLIRDGLDYYRQVYRELPNKYTGDGVYYKYIMDELLKGIPFEQSFRNVILKIDIEVQVMKIANERGLDAERHKGHFLFYHKCLEDSAIRATRNV